MKTSIGALCAALSLLLSPMAAQASLIGDTVACDIIGGGGVTCIPATASVVVPTEFKIFVPPLFTLFNIDFGSNDVLFTAVLGNSFSSRTIVDLDDLTYPFTAATLVSVSGITGLNVANVTLDMGRLLVDLTGTSSDAGAKFDIILSTVAAAVPEPASASLIGAGLIVLALARRWRLGQLGSLRRTPA